MTIPIVTPFSQVLPEGCVPVYLPCHQIWSTAKGLFSCRGTAPGVQIISVIKPQNLRLSLWDFFSNSDFNSWAVIQDKDKTSL